MIPKLARDTAKPPLKGHPPARSFVDGVRVGRSMEHDDEQAGAVFGGGVPHRVSRREVTVRPRIDDLVVDLKSPFDDHDGVGSCVPMRRLLRPAVYSPRSQRTLKLRSRRTTSAKI